MKSFPTDVVLSLTTGILLTRKGFDKMHELCEYVAGHSIWTHELASAPFVKELCEKVFSQHPDLRDAEEWNPNGAELETYLDAYVARQVNKYGPSLSIEKGTSERAESPVTTFERLAATLAKYEN